MAFTPLPDFDYLVKLVVVGSSGVGKSALLRRFSDDEFSGSYVSTIGVDFAIRSVSVNDKSVKLQIWDTAGQERFHGITTSYYRGAHAVIICLDVTDMASLHSIPKWLNEVESLAGDDVSVLIVANKCDVPYDPSHHTDTEPTKEVSLAIDTSPSSSSSSVAPPTTTTTTGHSAYRVVTTGMLTALSRSLRVPVIETSARDRMHVDTAFHSLTRTAIERMQQRLLSSSSSSSSSSSPSRTPPSSSGGVDLTQSPSVLRCCVIL